MKEIVKTVKRFNEIMYMELTEEEENARFIFDYDAIQEDGDEQYAKAARLDAMYNCGYID